MTTREKTVADYVTEKPSLSRVFERFGIDYCCGGKQPLTEACHRRGIRVADVIQALEEAGAESSAGDGESWQEAGISQLIDHIYDHHHRYLYEEMPRLSRMAQRVATVHGQKDPRLAALAETYETMRTELTMHMQKEENVLFPFCRELETAGALPRFHCGHIRNPIHVMGLEHRQEGQLLERMRELTDAYTPPDWACNTYRALLDGLAGMEADIHRHIHKENNILFPRVLALADALENGKLENSKDA